jgi:predicted benzoate:H+ symporter BenE
MSPDRSVADRLVAEARAKAARAESPTPGRVALAVGVVALVASPVSVLGWLLGATAVALGANASHRPAAARYARTAMVLGFAAILVGVFFFTLNLART